MSDAPSPMQQAQSASELRARLLQHESELKASFDAQAVGLFTASMQRTTALSSLAAKEADSQPQHVKDERERLRNEATMRARAAKEQLLPRITPEFLETLAMLSRYSGENTEYGPVVNVIDTYRLTGAAPPDVQPVNFWAP